MCQSPGYANRGILSHIRGRLEILKSQPEKKKKNQIGCLKAKQVEAHTGEEMVTQISGKILFKKLHATDRMRKDFININAK